MNELIEKIDALRRWKRQGIIKVTLAFRDDDFDTILNQIEIAVKNISSKPVLADRLPTSEDVKRWLEMLVGQGEDDMRKDIEATLRYR